MPLPAIRISKSTMTSLLGESRGLLEDTLKPSTLQKVLGSNWSPEYQATRFAMGENLTLLRALKEQPYYLEMSSEAQRGVDTLIQQLHSSKETMHADSYVGQSTFDKITGGLRQLETDVRSLSALSVLEMPVTPAAATGGVHFHWDAPEVVERARGEAAAAASVMRA